MAASGMLGAMPLSTKTFMPSGGISMPSSMITTLITPHQIGSNPQLLISGSTKGMVTTIAATSSNTAPATMNINISTATAAQIGQPEACTEATSACGAWVTVAK